MSNISVKIQHNSPKKKGDTMKRILRAIFSPILNIFEKGEEPFNYSPLHRKILLVMTVLFIFLASVSLYFAIGAKEWGGAIPFVVFLCVGLACLIIGGLGTDRAVAKIWGSK
ncbi:MAG: hypothetical protein ACI9Y1_002272 [Lentisphaeria bacterium]|jgi:hypothetical protein